MQQRLGKIWDKWNNQVKRQNQEECSSTIYKINSSNISSILRETSDNEIFKCSFCDLPLRPNVLMFHDTDVNVLKSIDSKRELYQRWEAKVEEQVEKSGKSLVIIELGCGKNVPAVRQESEEVFSDTLARIEQNQNHKETHSSSFSTKKVTLVRVNPKDSDIPPQLDKSGNFSSTISLSDTSLNALMNIDMWLDTLSD